MALRGIQGKPMGRLAANVPIQAMPNYIVRRRWTKRAPVAKAADSVTGARRRGGREFLLALSAKSLAAIVYCKAPGELGELAVNLRDHDGSD